MRSLQRSLLAVALFVAAALALSSARADSLSLGTAADFTVLGLNGTALDFSLVTVNGNVGVGPNGSLHVFAPSVVNGNVIVDPTATFKDDKPISQNIHGQVLTQSTAAAVSDAITAFNQYSSLAPTTSLPANGVVVGNGGTTVVDVTGGIKSNITLQGGPNDLFVLNVTGGINLGGSAAIKGVGITPDQIVIDLLDTSSVNTHVGNNIEGTVLAPHSSGNLDGTFNGRLIFGGESLTLLSGAVVNGPVVPAPAPFVASLGLLAAVGVLVHFRRRSTLA